MQHLRHEFALEAASVGGLFHFKQASDVADRHLASFAAPRNLVGYCGNNEQIPLMRLN